MKRFLVILNLLWVVAALALTTVSSLNALKHPINTSPFDDHWRTIFLAACGAIALCSLPFRGRPLLILSLLGLPAVLLVAIVWGGLGPALLLLAWLAALAALIGRRLIKMLDRQFQATPLEWAILSITLGFAAMILLTVIEGYCQFLYRALFYHAFAILTLLLLPGEMPALRAWLGAARNSLKRLWNHPDLRLISFTLGNVSIGIFCALLLAFAPSIQYDTLNYHLGIPESFVRHHGIFPLTEEYRFFWSHNAETLFTLAMLLLGQPLPSLLHLFFGLMAAGLVFEQGRLMHGERTGWLALLLFLTLPVIVCPYGMAYIDLFITFFCFAFIHCGCRWWQTQNPAWLALAGIYAGLALGTKLNAVFVLIPGISLIALGLASRKAPWPVRARRLGTLFVPLALLGAPWFIRDWAMTGNPVFPFLNSVFKSPLYEMTNRFQNFDSFGNGHAWFYFLRLPWDLIWNTDKFGEITPGGYAGALPLLSIAVLFGLAPRENKIWVRLLVAIGFIYLVFWFLIGQYIRYLLPIMPVFAILAAINLDRLWAALTGPIRSRALRFAVSALLVLLAFPWMFSSKCLLTLINFQNQERLPVSLWLGRETAENYLSRCLPVFKVYQYLERNDPAEHRILALGAQFRLYSGSRLFPPAQDLLNKSMNAGVFNSLHTQGYDYLLLDQNYFKADHWDPAVLAQWLTLKYTNNDIFLFSLAQPAPQAARNILGNAGFETQDRKGEMAAYYKFGKPRIDQTAAKAHGGKTAVCVGVNDGFYQRVNVKSDKIYTLGLWARADKPGQRGRLQVNWFDAQMKMIDVTIDIIQPGGEWKYYEIFLSSPANATCAQVYANSNNPSSWVWVDDLFLAEGTVAGKNMSGAMPAGMDSRTSATKALKPGGPGK